MRKTQLKLMIWALLLCVAALGAWGAVHGIGKLLLYFQTGADPASALHIVPNVPPDLHVDTAWRPDGGDTGRQVEPFTRTQIESAYLRAWLQWNLSYVKGQPFGLKTYFTGPALQSAGAAISAATAQGWRVEQADTRHRLELHFYSADGAIVAFTDHAAVVAQVIRDASGATVFAGETAADYDVVMFLEDGNWRVRHWVRAAATAEADARAAVSCPDCAVLAPDASTAARFSASGQSFGLAGINYYPRDTPWDLFWADYSPAVIDRDFTRIRGLGLNTVRVFVPFDQFGGAKVSPEMLARLGDLLDRARLQKLRVIVTLFDFRADYSLLRWPDADAHLRAILTQFAVHPAVLAWDLKNEPDLDYASAGRDTVNAWLEHVAGTARAADPNHLLTIGWSSPAAAAQLSASVDFVQFHYYAPADQLADAYATLRAAVGGRPIVLGEFGLPTWNSVFPHGHTAAEQASYYAALRSALRSTDSAGYLAWTLYDFPAVPKTVAGRWPWQTGPQRNMGVIGLDDTAKPAAALLAPAADLEVRVVASWRRWVKPFWLVVLGAALVVGALVLLMAARWLGRYPAAHAARRRLRRWLPTLRGPRAALRRARPAAPLPQVRRSQPRVPRGSSRRKHRRRKH